MLDLGTEAPPFTLLDALSGRRMSLDDLKGTTATVIMFICNHCPYVIHVREELVRLADDYRERGVSFIAISANDPLRYPEDAPEKMKEVAEEHRYPFPYLFDETQEVARAYEAACTPDFYIFDDALRLVYRGQLDGSRPRNDIPVTGADIRAALDALIEGRPVSADQRPSIGCNIKWRE